MLESLRQLYDKAVDFCREQSDAVMIGGAVLVVLIILIAVIRNARRHNEKIDDLEFDERKYMEDLLAAKIRREFNAAIERAEAKRAPASEAAAEDCDGSRGESRGETNERKASEAGLSEAAGTKVKPAGSGTAGVDAAGCEPVIPERCRKNVIFPEELIEEIAKASSKDLQEVEIKIQSAELRIKYAGHKDDSGAREEIKRFSGTEEKTERMAASQNTYAGSAGLSDTESRNEEALRERIQPEELPAGGGRRTGKFGPENFNTARSGRVFTEEELEKQIRD